MPTFGSLFAGIGGIDLGLERAGWECRWQVEWDAYCQRVLAKHWPDVPRYGDITEVDWSTVEPVDLLAGGFPCQPFSFAGKQQRMADDRWLWPEFARAIRELGPRYVLVENVPGLLVGGGMDALLGELAELGYDAEWESIPAAAVGAPHLRWRVWIVAYATGADARSGAGQLQGAKPSDWLPPQLLPDAGGGGGAAIAGDHHAALADADSGRQQSSRVAQPRGFEGSSRSQPDGRGALREFHDATLADAIGQRGRSGNGEREDAADAHAPGEGVGPGGDGGWWATEPDVGRVAHGVPARVDRLRALGNAVVPQVVEVIGRRLLEVMEAA